MLHLYHKPLSPDRRACGVAAVMELLMTSKAALPPLRLSRWPDTQRLITWVAGSLLI